MKRRLRTALLLLPALVLSFSSVASAGGGTKTHGTVYAGVTHSQGSIIYVAGDFTDKVLGQGAIVYKTTASSGNPGTIHVTAKKITIYTTKGSMTGSGEADQTFNSDGTSTISNGKFSLTKGTGAYEGHTFTGTFTGTFANGVYTFPYKATLK